MASVRRLSDRALKNVGRNTWLTDDTGLRGTGRLVARKSGQSNVLFYFRYSIAGKLKFHAIGPYSDRPRQGYFTLTEARNRAAGLSALYRDPATRDVKAAVSRTSPAVSTVQEAAQPAMEQAPDPSKNVAALCLFYAQQLALAGKKSARQVKGDLERYVVVSEFGQRPAGDVTSTEVATFLRMIKDRTKRGAGKIRAYLNAAYEKAFLAPTDGDADLGWLHFDIKLNPVKSTAIQGKAGAKTRNLNGRELGRFWLHLTTGPRADSVAYRTIRVTLLLGGQRLRQLLRCTAADFDDYEANICLLDPKGVRETARIHRIPLTSLALAEIQELTRISNQLDTPYIFSGKFKDSPINEGTVSRTVRDIRMKLMRLKLINQSFDYSDFRRTTESRMGELKITKEIKSRILSHGLSGVQEKHYDFAEYRDQILDALEKWTDFILRCAKAEEQAFAQAMREDHGT